ncbi:MAG: hypothetical protein ACLP2Y_14145 [Limisphaerales bacterium]
MKTLTAFFCLLFVANGVLADPYSAAIRQAKNVAANASNSRQDNDNPTPPAQPLPASPTQNNQPPDPVLEATRQNIAALRVDFDAFGDRADTNSAAAQKPSLTNNLAAAAAGTKPTPASIARLADDLMTAMAGNEKLRPQHQKLAQDVHAIFNSSHLSPAQQHKIIADVQTLLQNGEVPPDDVTNVVNDIKAIATETK